MKKLTLIVLFACMLVFFAACGKDGGSTPTPTHSGARNPWGLPVELNGGRIHDAANYDFGGRTLRVGAWWGTPISALAWGDEPQRATATNYPIDRMVWDNARRVEEVFNVRFEAVSVSYGNYFPNLLASVLEGTPLADVVILEGKMQMDARGNVIQPWDSVRVPYSDLLGSRTYITAGNQNDAGIWTIVQNGVDGEAVGLGINLDIIAADGLPNPIDLFEAGEWTWDAMLDIIRRGTRATGGAGVINQFGIGGQPGEIIQHLIGANDGCMVNADDNYGFDHPNTIVALEFAQQIFENRWWAAEAGGIMNTGNWDRNFYAWNRDGNIVMAPTTVWAIQNAPPAFNFGFVPFPKGPNNTTGSTWLSGLQQAIGVPVGTDWEVSDILVIMEEIFSWPCDEPEILYEAGDIEWFREMYPTEADVQRAVIAGNTRAVDVGRDVDEYYWVLGDFASHFWNHEMDVSQAVEYHRGPRQAMLNERFHSRN
jgi:multiple sugar transport system substrate-binding protein